MKYAPLTITLALAVLALCGYLMWAYLFIAAEEGGPAAAAESVALTGVVTEVDTSAVMVDGPGRVTVLTDAGQVYTVAIPSMGLPQCRAAAQIATAFDAAPGDRVFVEGALEDGVVVPCDEPTHRFTVVGTVEDEEFGYRFSYPKAPGGYLLEAAVPDAHPAVQHLRLTERARVEAVQGGEVPSEGPPTIELVVFPNPEQLDAADWVRRAPELAGATVLLAEPREAVVGGANAVHYVADGLYATERYAVTHGSYLYLLSGARLGVEDAIAGDFVALVESFTFIPALGQE